MKNTIKYFGGCAVLFYTTFALAGEPQPPPPLPASNEVLELKRDLAKAKMDNLILRSQALDRELKDMIPQFQSLEKEHKEIVAELERRKPKPESKEAPKKE